MSNDEHEEEIEIEVEIPAEQPAPAVEENPEGSEPVEDELPVEGEILEPIDYEEELEIVQGKLKKAERKIVKLKKEPKDASEEDLQEMEQRLEKRQDEKLDEIKKEALGGNRDNAIEAVSSGPSETKLIEFHLDNSIRPSGNIREDVKRAKILANEKKIISQVDELKQILISKETAGGPNFSGQKHKTTKKIIATPEDVRIANQMFGGDIARYLKHKQ